MACDLSLMQMAHQMEAETGLVGTFFRTGGEWPAYAMLATMQMESASNPMLQAGVCAHAGILSASILVVCTTLPPRLE